MHERIRKVPNEPTLVQSFQTRKTVEVKGKVPNQKGVWGGEKTVTFCPGKKGNGLVAHYICKIGKPVATKGK